MSPRPVYPPVAPTGGGPVCVGDVLSVYTWARKGRRESLAFHNGAPARDIWPGDPSELAAAALAAAMRAEASFSYAEVSCAEEAISLARKQVAALRLTHELDPYAIRMLLDDGTLVSGVCVLFEPRPMKTGRRS